MSTETNPEMTEMMELADRNNKTAIITIFWLFKGRQEHNKERNRRYKSQIKLLEVKNAISEMKNSIQQLASPRESDQRDKMGTRKKDLPFMTMGIHFLLQ